jgi:hypothetical protein
LFLISSLSSPLSCVFSVSPCLSLSRALPSKTPLAIWFHLLYSFIIRWSCLVCCILGSSLYLTDDDH